MQVMFLAAGRPAELAGAREYPTDARGFYWLDVERSEKDWQDKARHWLETRLHERHFIDSLNDQHPPYYDGTEDYDMLIIRSMDPACPTDSPNTLPVAIFVFPQAIVSVRSSGDTVFQKVHQRLLSGQKTSPNSPVDMLHLLLNQLVDSLLERRDALSELLSQWQDRMLGSWELFGDWRPIMNLRNRLRRLEFVCGAQIEALDRWRENTNIQLDENLKVRFNDLSEHLGRVLHHAEVMQHDIDSLVQIYFSAASQRTNQILQFLTVVSVVFLPLNLIAGLFGMNFEFIPFLHDRHGIWVALAVMATTAAAILLWSRKRRWF